VKKPLKTSNTAVHNINYHIIWCPKYRRKLLAGRLRRRLIEPLYEKAQRMGIEIVEMEIMPDHVHLFIRSNPRIAPNTIVKHLKGYSSRILRFEFSNQLSRMPVLWTRSYYCESVGHISEETIRKYIASQGKSECSK
jgi:putative transposase